MTGAALLHLAALVVVLWLARHDIRECAMRAEARRHADRSGVRR